MAIEKVEGRELTWRTLFPWTELFRGFQVALDLNKLFLAASGIVVMAFGWWVLALIFGSSTKPDWPTDYTTKYPPAVVGGVNPLAWENFKHDREQWNLMHEATGCGGDDQRVEPADLADSPQELDLVRTALAKVPPSSKTDVDKAINSLVKEEKLTPARGEVYENSLYQFKPAGTLATWPWSENRGPNPFLLVTGQAGIPWTQGHFPDWFLRHQLPVVLEPLVKFVLPLVYFFKPQAAGWPRLYFFLVFVWTVLTWSFFGGAITRIAAVQVARGEKIGFMDAVNFTVKRIVSYLTAPLFPIGFIIVLVVFAIIFGLIQLIPFFGDFFSGILWLIPLVLGLLVSVTLVGLVVGWPLMSPTISAEGTDSWEAVSRSFSYVFSKPFHYLWYWIVAACYGAILIFFVGFMGSFAVYMAKWAVTQTPFITMTNRDPTYLMVYAPKSFGWRTLLLQGAQVDGNSVVQNGVINEAALTSFKSEANGWHWYNTAGAVLVAIWLAIVFLLIIGFGYSYFWSAITIIYMLMRRVADGAELDEVYLEEDDTEGVFGSSPTPPAAPTPPFTKPTQPLTMVEPPALRTSPAPVTTSASDIKTELPVTPPSPTTNGGTENLPPS